MHVLCETDVLLFPLLADYQYAEIVCRKQSAERHLMWFLQHGVF